MKRRALFQLLAATAAAQQPPAPRIPKEALPRALDLLGLEFTEAERDLMAPGVNRALGQFEALRKIDVPLGTEPAFRFSPVLPGAKRRSGPARFRPSRVAAPKKPDWKAVEELAFLPVTRLAALVRARLVTSTELTRMYLERLKKYSPKLNCLITLTEELALRQAAQADREIRAGRYRGERNCKTPARLPSPCLPE